MATWFTADTHFGHEGIVETCGRPFADARRMDDALVQLWNAMIGPKDTVWHLGDFAHARRGHAASVFKRLNGTKHLVAGNHDGDEARTLGWASVQDAADVHVDGVRLVLFHYPILSWRGCERNRGGHVEAVMLHGHVHGTLRDPRVPHVDPCRLDVGVDMRSMAPVSVETLLAEARVGALLAAEGTVTRP